MGTAYQNMFRVGIFNIHEALTFSPAANTASRDGEVGGGAPMGLGEQHGDCDREDGEGGVRLHEHSPVHLLSAG